MSSIRQIEAALRASGMSAAEAKRTASERLAATAALDPTSSESPHAMSSVLKRAFAKVAPSYAYVADFPNNPHINYSAAQLRQARAALVDGLLDVAMPDWEQQKALVDPAIKELDTMIRAKLANQSNAARSARPVAGQEGNFSGGQWGGAPLLRNATTGQPIRTYRAHEPIASDGGEPDFGIGDMVRAACTGDWNRLPSHVRAGSAGIGASGGFLIPSELAGFAVDLARAKARCLEAGAQTVPMTNGNLSIAVVTGDPTAAWKAENAAFAVSQGGYGRIELVTHTLGVIVPLSLELVMSASNINQLVMSQLTQRLALQLDSAAISGDGFLDKPRGIVSNLPAGNIVTVGAQLTSDTAYGKYAGAIGKCLHANAELDALSILHNSDVETALDSLTDTLYQPLRPTPNYAKIKDAGRTYVANGIDTAGTPKSTYSVVGDFSQLLFGMQQSLMIEVSREGSYETGGVVTSAFAHGQVLVRAFMMLDIAVLRPDFFAQVADIRIP